MWTIIDSAARAAWFGATSQQGQLDALLTAIGSSPRLAVMNASLGELSRVTLASPSINTGTTPRRLELGDLVAGSLVHTAAGTPAFVEVRTSGGTVILRAAAGTSGAFVNFAGNIKQRCAPSIAATEIVVSSNSSLPATGTPSWLSGKAVHEWVEIAGTSGAGGAQVDPWGAFAIDPEGRIFVAASGGHNDSSDNRVVVCDLTADSPSWTVLEAASASVQENVSHYSPDNHPTSRHNYHNAFYIPSLDRIFLVGSQASYGGPAPAYDNVDAYHVSGLAWDAKDTYAPVPEGDGTYKAGVVWDGTRVWSNTLRTYNPVTDTWASGATAEHTNGNIIDSPWSYDSTRGQILGLSWGTGRASESDLRCARVPVTGSSKIAVTITSNSARTAWESERPGYAGMDYDPENDRHLFFSAQTRDTDGNVTGNLPGKVYTVTRVSDNEYSLGTLTLTGTAPGNVVSAGVNGRFKYVPALKGFVYLPQRTSNLFFFRVA